MLPLDFGILQTLAGVLRSSPVLGLRSPQAQWDPVQPSCQAAPSLGLGTSCCRLSFAMGGQSQQSLPPLLAVVVVAALGHPAGFVLSVGLRAQPRA